MNVFQDIRSVRELVSAWRREGERIAFVPTMGNLHEGHLSLVEIAQQYAERVIVSIYVNPLQFAPTEDFASYPRTMEDDLRKLRLMGVDLVFTPDSHTIYPEGEQQCAFVDVPELSQILEGEFRPGFFKGVCTVVLKLFNIVQADYAVFGEKDYQQLLIVKQMVNDLNLPIEIISAPIKREADGLAMSSRNTYLDVANREKSTLLSATLQACCEQVAQGMSIEEAENIAVNTLKKHGFTVDYVTFRETVCLTGVTQQHIADGTEYIVLAAAKIGNTRLIDNMKPGKQLKIQS